MNALKTWRIMGMTTTDDELLIVMGSSREECRSLFVDALSDYSTSDLKEVETAWLEEWTHDELFDRWAWIPTEEVSLHRIRLKTAAVQWYAKRRESEVAAC